MGMGWDLHINSGISRISFGQTNYKVITCKKDGLYSNKVFSAEGKKREYERAVKVPSVQG